MYQTCFNQSINHSIKTRYGVAQVSLWYPDRCLVSHSFIIVPICIEIEICPNFKKHAASHLTFEHSCLVFRSLHNSASHHIYLITHKPFLFRLPSPIIQLQFTCSTPCTLNLLLVRVDSDQLVLAFGTLYKIIYKKAHQLMGQCETRRHSSHSDCPI